MKKFFLFLIFFLGIHLLNAQTSMPQISSEDDSNEFWYVLKFVDGGAVIEDMGDGEKLLTKPFDPTVKDEQLWKIIPSEGETYQLVCKTGRKLHFAEDRFRASATEAINIELDQYNANWEIRQSGEKDFALNMVGGGGNDRELATWYKNQGGNKLNFITTEELIASIFPKISDDDSEYWYYIYNLLSDKYLQDNDAEEISLNNAGRDNASQLWKITGTYEDLVIENKLGKKMLFVAGDADLLTTSDTQSSSFNLLFFDGSTPSGGDLPFIGNATFLQCFVNDFSGDPESASDYLNATDGTLTRSDKNNPGNALIFKSANEISYKPDFSSEDQSNENWYIIKFDKGEGVFQDMGDGVNLKTQKFLSSDNQLWKFVPTENVNKYEVLCKTGRKLAFVGDRFVASSTEAAIIKLIRFNNKWEISVDGKDGTVNPVGGEGFGFELGLWGQNIQQNKLDFFSADYLIKGFLPQFSNTTEETWYYILNLNTGKVFSAQNDQSVNLEYALRNKNEQLWKLTGTFDDFGIENQNGDKIYFKKKDNDDNLVNKLAASATESNSFKLLPFTGDKTWGDAVPLQISNNDINGENPDDYYLSWIDNALGQSYVNNEENALILTTEDKMFIDPDMPELGKWYYLQFQNSLVVLEEIEEGLSIRTNNPVADNASQLWKITGDEDNYVIESKRGHKLHFNTDKNEFEALDGTDFTFKLLASSNVLYPKSWEIVGNGLDESKSMVQAGGAGLDRIISIWTYPDNGTAIKFIDPDEMVFNKSDMPIISTAEYTAWYNMHFYLVTDEGYDYKVIAYQGENEKLAQEDFVQGSPNQLWKITRSDNIWGEYLITNYDGAQMYFDDGKYHASSSISNPTIFNFNTTTAYDNCWAMKRKDATGQLQWINSVKVGGNPIDVGEWTQNDKGSAVLFVRVPDEDIISSIEFNAASDADKISLSTHQNLLRIEGSNLESISIYSIVGELLYNKAKSTEFLLPVKGYYIIHIYKNNGTVEALKCLVK